MKKFGVWIILIIGGVTIGFVAHKCDKAINGNYSNSSGESVQEEYDNSSSNYSTSKTCSYCANSFSGEGYNYAYGECHQGDGTYYSKCSLKCCRESLQSDPNLDSRWK